MEKAAEKKTFKQKVSDEMKIWKETFKNLKKDLSEDPEKAGTFIAGALSLVGGLIGIGISLARNSNDENRIEDDFVGSYWNLDIDVTNQQLLELNQLMIDEGISKGEALNRLGWLKEEKKRK